MRKVDDQMSESAPNRLWLSRIMRRELLVAILSVFVIGLTILFLRERFFFLPSSVPPGIRSLFFPNVILISFTLVLLILRKRLFEDPPSLVREVRKSLPLIVYYLFAASILLIAYSNAYSSAALNTFALSWWRNTFLVWMSVPTAFLLGVLLRGSAQKFKDWSICLLLTCTLVTGAAEVFWNYGIKNPIYGFWHWWNTSISSVSNIWVWNGVEDMRVAGFAHNPAFFSYIGVIGVLWAFAAQKTNIFVRITLTIMGLSIVLMGGSRAGLLAIAISLLLLLFFQRKEIILWLQDKIFSKLSKAAGVTIVAAVSVVFLLVMYLFVTIPLSGALGRFQDSLLGIFGLAGREGGFDFALLSGRADLWTNALSVIGDYPWGAGLLDQQIGMQGIHNFFLSAWVAGGPLFLLALLALLVWVFRIPAMKSYRYLPVFLGVYLVVQGTIGNSLPGGAINPFVFFLLGIVTFAPMRKKGSSAGAGLAQIRALLSGKMVGGEGSAIKNFTGGTSDFEWTKYLIFAQIAPLHLKRKNGLSVISLCAYINRSEESITAIPFHVGELQLIPRFFFGRGIKIPFTAAYLNVYSYSTRNLDLNSLRINNYVHFLISRKDKDHKVPIVFDALNLITGRYRTSPIFLTDSGQQSLYFRQTVQNSACLTLRGANITDSKHQRLLIFLAQLAARITPQRNRMLIFEKQLKNYSESGSVLFERLCVAGNRHVRFVIKKDSPQYELIPQQYRKAIIPAYTWRHYYSFFATGTFVGTEALQHAIELRCCVPRAQRKVNSSKNKYVFLQHGVMYMVSLDSPLRTAFSKAIQKYNFHRIVVSSELEAQHFIDSADMSKDSLYVSGLPSYDSLIQSPAADKIVIMPTWREWEYNQALTDPENTAYYRMMLDLYESVPENLRNRTYLLPHPLFLEAFRASPLAKYIPDFESYTDLLRDCSLLLTDYSSIAYAAFYAGANVVFYWKDKEECAQYYQAPLMIDEQSAFGDVCWDAVAVTESIKGCYGKPQSPRYLERYQRIVSFHDGKNTDRLIQMMQDDGLLG